MALSVGEIEATLRLKDEMSAGLRQAQTQLQQFGKSISGIGSSMQQAGIAMTAAFTVPIALIGGGAIKAAADFEHSFANVSKTVGGTKDQMDVLAQSIRDLSKEIPVTTKELNAIAAIGGQMDVPIAQIENFTRHVAALGVAVDGISVEEAAMGLAQIGNIVGTGAKDIAAYASALVHLGNKSAATEGQILEFTQRLIGVGHNIGLTVEQVMALGTTMASLGLNAEMGGTAFSTVMSKMQAAVEVGGEKLHTFADIARKTDAEFAQMFKDTPIKAIQAFLEGLKQSKDAGEALTPIIASLGTEGTRVRDVLTRFSGASLLLAKDLGTASEGILAQNKHLVEAEAKYKTFTNQLVLVGNKLRDIGVTIGLPLIEGLKSMLDAMEPVFAVLERMAEAFNALPGPVKAAGIAVLGLAALAGPVTIFAGAVIRGFGDIMSAVGGVSRLMPELIQLWRSLSVAMGLTSLTNTAAGITSVATAWKGVTTAMAGTAIANTATAVTGLAASLATTKPAAEAAGAALKFAAGEQMTLAFGTGMARDEMGRFLPKLWGAEQALLPLSGELGQTAFAMEKTGEAAAKNTTLWARFSAALVTFGGYARTALAAIGGWPVVLGTVAAALVLGTDGIKSLGSIASSTTSILVSFASQGIKTVGDMLGAVGTKFSEFMNWLAKVNPEVKALTEVLGGLRGMLAKVAEGMSQVAGEAAAGNWTTLANALRSSSPLLAGFLDAMTKSAQPTKRTGQAVADLTTMLEASGGSMTKFAIGAKQADFDLSGLGTTTLDFSEKAARAAKSANGVSKGLEAAQRRAEAYAADMLKLSAAEEQSILTQHKQGVGLDQLAKDFGVAQTSLERFVGGNKEAAKELAKTTGWIDTFKDGAKKLEMQLSMMERAGVPVTIMLEEFGSEIEKVTNRAPGLGVAVEAATQRAAAAMREMTKNTLLQKEAAEAEERFKKFTADNIKQVEEWQKARNTKVVEGMEFTVKALNDYATEIEKASMHDVDFKVAQLERERDAQLAALKRTVGDHAAAADAIKKTFALRIEEVRKTHNEELAKMSAAADTWGNRFRSVIESIPQLLQQALTGGGGMAGFGKALTSMLGQQIGGKAISDGLTSLVNKFATSLSGAFGTGFVGMLGNMIPGIGAAIGSLVGPLVDKIAGLFGSKGRDMVKEFADSMGGFDALHVKLNALGAEGERLWVRLTQGVGRNNPKEAEAAIKAINDALAGAEAAAAKATAGITTFMAGATARVGAFFDTIKAAKDAVKDMPELEDADGNNLPVEPGNIWKGIMNTLGGMKSDVIAEFQQMGLYAGTAFAASLKENGWQQAIADATPMFDQLAQLQTDLGVQLEGSAGKFLAFFESAKANKDVLAALDGITKMIQGAGDAIFLNQELFTAFGQDAVTQFTRLTERGVELNQALVFMQPTLQALWEAQQKFGLETDAATQKMIDLGVQQGIVGANMKSVNDKILDVLLAIADVFGAKIPAGLQQTASASAQTAADIERNFLNAGKGIKDGMDQAAADVAGAHAKIAAGSSTTADEVLRHYHVAARGIKAGMDQAATDIESAQLKIQRDAAMSAAEIERNYGLAGRSIEDQMEAVARATELAVAGGARSVEQMALDIQRETALSAAEIERNFLAAGKNVQAGMDKAAEDIKRSFGKVASGVESDMKNAVGHLETELNRFRPPKLVIDIGFNMEDVPDIQWPDPPPIRPHGDLGFASGTPGLDYMNFGSGTSTVLHGEEAVIPRPGVGALAGDIADVLGPVLSARSAGGTMTIVLNQDGRRSAEWLVPFIPGVVRRLGLI